MVIILLTYYSTISKFDLFLLSNFNTSRIRRVLRVFAVTTLLFISSKLPNCWMLETKIPRSTDSKEIPSALLIDILTWLENSLGFRGTKVYSSMSLEMASD